MPVDADNDEVEADANDRDELSSRRDNVRMCLKVKVELGRAYAVGNDVLGV